MERGIFLLQFSVGDRIFHSFSFIHNAGAAQNLRGSPYTTVDVSPLSPAPSGSLSSVPSTSEGVSILRARQTPSKPLKINTDCGRRIFLAGSSGLYTTVFSMHTALESATPYSSYFSLPTPPSISKISLSWTSSSMPSSVDLGVYATPGSRHVDSTWDTDTDCTSSSYPFMSSDGVVGFHPASRCLATRVCY